LLLILTPATVTVSVTDTEVGDAVRLALFSVTVTAEGVRSTSPTSCKYKQHLIGVRLGDVSLAPFLPVQGALLPRVLRCREELSGDVLFLCRRLCYSPTTLGNTESTLLLRQEAKLHYVQMS